MHSQVFFTVCIAAYKLLSISWKFEVSIFNSTEFTAIQNLGKIMRSQKNAQNRTSVGLLKCICLRNY